MPGILARLGLLILTKGERMGDPRWINPKNSKGYVLEIDQELYDRMPTIVEAYFHGRYAYKTILRFDATGTAEDREWVIYGDNWHIQMDAGFVSKENRFILMILAHPEGEHEVRSIGKILNGQRQIGLRGLIQAHD